MNRPNESEFSQARAAVIDAATELQTSAVPFIDGVRRIASMRFSVSALDHDPDFMLFVAIDSESDHLPGPQQRALCAPAWLAQCEEEAHSIEERWSAEVRDACVKLVLRFQR